MEQGQGPNRARRLAAFAGLGLLLLGAVVADALLVTGKVVYGKADGARTAAVVDILASGRTGTVWVTRGESTSPWMLVPPQLVPPRP